MDSVLRRFWSDERGAEMIEWAVVTVVLLVATVPAILVMRDGLLALYRDVFDALEKEPPTDY
ncbi:MAG: Flp family type IVb pilin [Anaerolineae bacterium]